MVSENDFSPDFRWVREGIVDFGMLLVCCLAMVGCAGTPRWVGGNDTNTYYYQGRRIDRGLSVAVAGWRGDPGPEDDGGEVGECSGVALG